MNGRPEAAASRAGGAVVDVEGVTKRYGERIIALDDVSFRLRRGEFALVTGPSGSGKSTLLNLVAGFDVPDSGRILVDGVPVTAVRDVARFRREVIGFVFQMHQLIEGLNAAENVEIALMPCALRHAERRARARAALTEVGLAARESHLPSQLSGGERQRTAVARALVNRPRLLLADEPTGALDSAAAEQLLDLFRTLRDRHGMTILLVSHEPAAARYADRSIHLRDGRVV